jgi:hypothetical protein
LTRDPTSTLEIPTTNAPDTLNQPVTRPTVGVGVRVIIDFGGSAALPAGTPFDGLDQLGRSALFELKTL